jgi:Glycosyl transferase family 2
MALDDTTGAAQDGDVLLSACLIVRQEEAHLGRCLGSLRGVADDLVVVDTGSTDRTIAIARAHGARVIEIRWPDDFAAARNVSLAAAVGDWILVVDADEELLPGSLPGALESVAADGLLVKVRNLAPPGEIAAWEETPIVRLFRRDDRVRYEGAIHEQVTPSIVRAGGRIAGSEVVLVHHGYASATAQGESRAARNQRALERALAGAPDDAYLWFQLGATQKALGQDGRPALEKALALGLAADTRATAHLKLAQLALGRHDDRTAAAQARAALAIATTALGLHVLGVALIGLGELRAGREALVTLRSRADLNPAHRGDLDRLIAALG